MGVIVDTYIAFSGPKCVAEGFQRQVLSAVKLADSTGAEGPILIFNAATGEQVEFDLQGTLDEVLEKAGPETRPVGRGRPRLGVTSREVTLLPQHWEWLEQQPHGVSGTLRRLVSLASKEADETILCRRRQDRAYRFMSAMAGNYPHFEEASRALFAGDYEKLSGQIQAWPPDVRSHLLKMLETEPEPAEAMSKIPQILAGS